MRDTEFAKDCKVEMTGIKHICTIVHCTWYGPYLIGRENWPSFDAILFVRVTNNLNRNMISCMAVSTYVPDTNVKNISELDLRTLPFVLESENRVKLSVIWKMSLWNFETYCFFTQVSCAIKYQKHNLHIFHTNTKLNENRKQLLIIWHSE